MNKYAPHVYVIPEDDADRQIADGFVLYHRVKEARIQVVPPAGGWFKVLETFRDEYIPKLCNYPTTHVVMLVDFDDQVEKRRADFEQEIPTEFKPRVFVLGSKHTPETLKKEVRKSFEEIGKTLADDCDAGTAALWGHEQLSHNDADRKRLVETVMPFLF
ncbi:MAG TPA: hypothetical protein VG125_26315 [Pirellulales bacterium]|jgi:hypothetical protein|nr:hypothetical protein [Pirellulales bacterium]